MPGCPRLGSYFNPRSRVGNDSRLITGFLRCDYFNPRSRVGNDISDGDTITNGSDFNPRSRVGNDGINDAYHNFTFDFNPRSRVGNDQRRGADDQEHHEISIHVPAWGTTKTDYRYILTYLISIHVPAWGTTLAQRHKKFGFKISIHVPAWGTTMYQCCMTDINRFQSTFPRGERPVTCQIKSAAEEFQSTFPRGERPKLWETMPDDQYISIHVPAWGTTGRRRTKQLSLINFNPRSRVGNDSQQMDI